MKQIMLQLMVREMIVWISFIVLCTFFRMLRLLFRIILEVFIISEGECRSRVKSVCESRVWSKALTTSPLPHKKKKKGNLLFYEAITYCHSINNIFKSGRRLAMEFQLKKYLLNILEIISCFTI